MAALSTAGNSIAIIFANNPICSIATKDICGLVKPAMVVWHGFLRKEMEVLILFGTVSFATCRSYPMCNLMATGGVQYLVFHFAKFGIAAQWHAEIFQWCNSYRWHQTEANVETPADRVYCLIFGKGHEDYIELNIKHDEASKDTTAKRKTRGIYGSFQFLLLVFSMVTKITAMPTSATASASRETSKSKI